MDNNSQQKPQSQASTQIQKAQRTITDKVLKKVNELQEAEQLQLPQNYSASNSLKGAWLVLNGATDGKGANLLQKCSEVSIANALFDMVIQGLSVTKKQCYFIPYGDKLICQRSYFGTVALAKRTGAILEDPVANVVYEGDEFIYSIDPRTGFMHIESHKQTLESIDGGKIKAVYCICQTPKGERATLMTMGQVQKAWQQSATKGNSPAHTNFSDEMAKKTVIGRACKMAINSSNDAWLFGDKSDETDTDVQIAQRNAETTHNGVTDFAEDAEYEEVKTHEDPQPEAAPTEQTEAPY